MGQLQVRHWGPGRTQVGSQGRLLKQQQEQEHHLCAGSSTQQQLLRYNVRPVNAHLRGMAAARKIRRARTRMERAVRAELTCPHAEWTPGLLLASLEMEVTAHRRLLQWSQGHGRRRKAIRRVRRSAWPGRCCRAPATRNR